jgi:hypothetical protein
MRINARRCPIENIELIPRAAGPKLAREELHELIRFIDSEIPQTTLALSPSNRRRC